jgi:hypothetical protein
MPSSRVLMLQFLEAREPPALAERMNRLASLLNSRQKLVASWSLTTESCRLGEVGSLVKDLPTKDARGAKTKHPSAESFSDSVAAGHTDSLNARGEDLRRFDTKRRPLRNENPAALAVGVSIASFRGKAVDPLVGLGAGHVLERLAEAVLQTLDAVLAPPLDG